MANLYCFNSVTGHSIATNFFTCLDSCAVMENLVVITVLEFTREQNEISIEFELRLKKGY